MNQGDEIALEESISDCKKKAIGMEVHRKNPLCTLGESRNVNSDNRCNRCIIRLHTGRIECYNTPLWDDKDHNASYYQNKIIFLESLRPKKKVKKNIIKIGKTAEVDFGFGTVTSYNITKVKGGCVTLERPAPKHCPECGKAK